MKKMKVMKKSLAVFLAVMMCVTFQITALAQESTEMAGLDGIPLSSIAFVSGQGEMVNALNEKKPVIILLNDFTISALTIDYDVSIAASVETTVTNREGHHFNVEGDEITITFQNVKLDGGSIGVDAGIKSTANKLTIIDGFITNSNYGVYAVGDVVIDGGTYSNCRQAIYSLKHVELQAGTIRDNNSYIGGAAVYALGGFSMNGGTIVNNYSGYRSPCQGGAVYAENSFNMSGGVITGNSVTGNGGGVYFKGGIIFVTGGSIAYNRSSEYGGGIFADTAIITVNGGSVVRNHADRDGGGVCAQSCKVPMLVGVAENTPNDFMYK